MGIDLQHHKAVFDKFPDSGRGTQNPEGRVSFGWDKQGEIQAGGDIYTELWKVTEIWLGWCFVRGIIFWWKRRGFNLGEGIAVGVVIVFVGRAGDQFDRMRCQ